MASVTLDEGVLHYMHRALRGASSRLRVPPYLWDEVVDESTYLLWKDVERYDGHSYGSLHRYIAHRAKYRVVDALRTLSPGSRSGKDRYQVFPLECTDDGEPIGMTLACYDDVDDVNEGRNELIEKLADDDRDREIMVRIADGETLAEIGTVFGVSESWICHMKERYRRKAKMLGIAFKGTGVKHVQGRPGTKRPPKPAPLPPVSRPEMVLAEWLIQNKTH